MIRLEGKAHKKMEARADVLLHYLCVSMLTSSVFVYATFIYDMPNGQTPLIKLYRIFQLIYNVKYLYSVKFFKLLHFFFKKKRVKNI